MCVLTEKQQAFAEHYVTCNSAREAAKRAGYAESVCKNAYREVLGSNAVQERISELREEVRAEVKQRLAHAAAKAVKYLEAVVEDEDAPHTARVRAADSLLDRSGYERRTTSEELSPSSDLEAFLASIGTTSCEPAIVG